MPFTLGFLGTAKFFTENRFKSIRNKAIMKSNLVSFFLNATSYQKKKKKRYEQCSKISIDFSDNFRGV